MAAEAAPSLVPVPLARTVRGSGPPIVLVAGTGYPGATWPPEVVEPLARRHTVVTFDHRGTGASPGTAGPYSTRLFAADLVRLLDELDIGSAHLVGHSMGGRVAQWVALDHPKRIRSLILAASGPGQFDPAHRQTQGVPVATALGIAEQGFERYLDALVRRSFFSDEFARAHPDRVAWLVAAFWEHRPALEDYLKHVAARQEHRTTDRLGEIRQPTLVLIGDRDRHVGGTGSHWDQSQYLAANLPHAELEVIGDALHGFFWSHAAEAVDIIERWVDRQELAR